MSKRHNEGPTIFPQHMVKREPALVEKIGNIIAAAASPEVGMSFVFAEFSHVPRAELDAAIIRLAKRAYAEGGRSRIASEQLNELG